MAFICEEKNCESSILITHNICKIKLKLFGMADVHINRSGSYWDNLVFYLLFWPCLEMTFYQHLCGTVIKWFVSYLKKLWRFNPGLAQINGVPGKHVTYLALSIHRWRHTSLQVMTNERVKPLDMLSVMFEIVLRQCSRAWGHTRLSTSLWLAGSTSQRFLW